MNYGLVGLVVLILDIVAIIHILRSGLEPTMKLIWILLVLILPLVGMVLWFVIGDKEVKI